jgi:hypothetical protein
MLVFFSFLFIAFNSCTEEVEFFPIQESDEILYPGVDERLWPHFAEFESEAAVRGLNIDLIRLNIEGVIESIDEDNIAGMCQYGGNQPRLLTVDENFWNRSDYLYREFIVFHELGHCALSRDHSEIESTKGICQSIMRSGLTGCRDNYRTSTRDQYLDELFSTTGGL